MRRLYARVLARLIRATRWIDTAHALFDDVRSRQIVSAVSEKLLAKFNTLAHQRYRAQVPEVEQSRHHLFACESVTIRRFFPPTPTRLIVGGAGASDRREAFTLAALGYQIVAFEPAAELATGMAERTPSGMAVRACRARYRTLPFLAPARSGEPAADLRELAPFCGALMDCWGSFSHLITQESRARALGSLGDAESGPTLLSFLAFRRDLDPSSPRRNGHGVEFSVFSGYHHASTPSEVDRHAREAGLGILRLESDQSQSSLPHAVLSRRRDA